MTRGSAGQRGIVLLIVLWTIAMMTLIVVAITAFAQRGVSLAQVETDRLRSAWALRAGVEAAKAYVLGLRPEERLSLAGRELTLDVGQGRQVRVVIREGAGLVDLNRAEAQLLEAVFRQAGLDDAASARLTESLEALRRKAQDAAKARQPAIKGDDQKTVSAGLVSTAQLRSFTDDDPATLNAVMPLVGLYSLDGKINPLAAPDSVLQAIPDIEPQEIGAIRAARMSGNLKGPIAAVIEKHAAFLAINEPKVFVIAATTLAGPRLVAGDSGETVVIFESDGEPPRFHTLALSW
jgi:general secretion pathway protein K